MKSLGTPKRQKSKQHRGFLQQPVIESATDFPPVGTFCSNSRPFLNVCCHHCKNIMFGTPRAGACATHIDVATLRSFSLAALLRNACHAQTMRLLRREVRLGPSALVSDTILLEALPGQIPRQGRRAKKVGAPLAGFLARGVISIRSRASIALSVAAGVDTARGGGELVEIHSGIRARKISTRSAIAA